MGEGHEAGGAGHALGGGGRPARRRCDSTPTRSRRLLGDVVERLGEKPKNVYQPIRVAITGTTVSPGIFDSLAALGRDESLRRIDAAIERLGD